MKQVLPRLDAFFRRVIESHGVRHGKMLKGVQGAFEGLQSEMEMHLM